MEDEHKILEEKKQRIETEYIDKKNNYEKEFNKCITKNGLSQEEQQNCYRKKHQNLDKIKIERSKQMEEAQNHFKEQSALQCSICLDDMGCTDNIKVLPCLHEFHYKCIHDVIKSDPISYRCPICRRTCNFLAMDPIDNLQSMYFTFFIS